MDRTRLGRAEISPTGEFATGSSGTWTVTHVVGDFGIDDGGSIAVARRAVCDSVFPQTDDPKAVGYTTVSVETQGGAKFRAFYDDRWWIRPWWGCLVVRIHDGSLAPGDKVSVTFGDASQGSPGWRLQTFPERRHTFMVLVDACGTREYYEVAESPCISLIPAAPVRVEAIVPSVIRPREPVDVGVRLMDRFGNPSGEGSRAVRFLGEGFAANWEHSSELEFSGGIARIREMKLPEQGTGRLSVSVDGMEGASNPFVVSETAPRVCWADMHGQTRGTIGTGSIEEYFAFARDKALIDVTAWQGNDLQITDALWDEVCAETRRFNAPGRFVTFLGYEWSGTTPNGGDHNILYLADDQPVHRSSHWLVNDGSSEASDRRPISRLWEEFSGRDDVMAIAHVGGRYANLDYYDPDMVRLVEIHSHHGTFEWLAEDAFRRGFRVGLVGQSDDHSGRPGLSAPLEPLGPHLATFDVWGGLTGVFAKDLTRERVWQALRARHCYATSGRRILLDVRSGTHAMGDVVQGTEPPPLDIRIIGTAPVLDVEIRRDADVVHRHIFAGDYDAEWIRVMWSGVRIRSRNKRTTWHGTLSVTSGKIEQFEPFAFDRSDEGVSRISDASLRIRSTTAGDVDGVFVKVSDPEALLIFESAPARAEMKVAEIGHAPVTFDAGGVNQRVVFVRTHTEGRPSTVEFTYKDAKAPPGAHAYWVKVTQVDGHMAWSSPIFFEPTENG